jgi:hypothetical protein
MGWIRYPRIARIHPVTRIHPVRYLAGRMNMQVREGWGYRDRWDDAARATQASQAAKPASPGRPERIDARALAVTVS